MRQQNQNNEDNLMFQVVILGGTLVIGGTAFLISKAWNFAKSFRTEVKEKRKPTEPGAKVNAEAPEYLIYIQKENIDHRNVGKIIRTHLGLDLGEFSLGDFEYVDHQFMSTKTMQNQNMNHDEIKIAITEMAKLNHPNKPKRPVVMRIMGSTDYIICVIK